MSKTVRLGNRLRYPITIVKLLKSPGEPVKKQEPLMQYSFKWMKEVGDTIGGETWEEEQTTIVTWDSPTDGELKQWHIREGQFIEADGPCLAVKEACSHEIQFQGLCAICGKDMTEVNWAAESQDTDRAPISMVHDQTSLTVSAVQAQRTEQELQRRLLQSRKLSLVVDLDQTIIQACIDPTVGEWMKDPTNPNYESVKEVKTFQLDDGPYGSARRCWYYIKMRPGLEGFLKRISEMYELHVYTMGTRAYAQNVARVVDPDKRLFGNRVISRDENGNMYAKSLQRLFPVSTNMVVIIDDRSDVWPRNRPNLIKVSPYEFFKGIGDINSSFLPKRQDLLTSDATTNGVRKKGKRESALKDGKKDEVSALEAVIDMTGGDDSALTKRQLEEQERAFEKQIKDRPLQLLQEKLDREDEEAERATVQSEDGSESRSSSPPPQRHRVLLDDDNELAYLERHLTLLHKAYYEEYDRKRASHKAGGNVDLASVPDVGRVLDGLKSKVLQGCKIVLSGVLQRGIDIYRSEIGLQIVSFGAELRPQITRDVTHLVVNAAQPGRDKLLEARRRPHIKIVSLEWLADCFSQWAALDETPYLFTARLVGEEELSSNKKPGNVDVVGPEDDTDGGDNDGKTPNGRTVRGESPRLKLISPAGKERELEDDDADSDGEDGGESDDDDGDDDEDEEGLLPDEIQDGQLSPIDGLKTFNWGSCDAELNEFLASGSSDDEDDDDGDEEEEEEEGNEEDEDSMQDEDNEDTGSSTDSARKNKRKSPSPSRKRKHPGPEEEGSDPDLDPGTESERTTGDESTGRQAKRLRRTKRLETSSLRNQYVSDANSGLPTPRVTGDEEDVALLKGPTSQAGDGKQLNGAGDGAGDGDGDLEDFDEAELEAEFEAEFEAEEAAIRAEAEGLREKG
ncbi:hypothetical protein VTK56DRAFT_2421 [Thermocarpiscus australiensis]